MIILNVSVKGGGGWGGEGDYFRDQGAINRGTAIIRENTVWSFSMYKDNWGISVNDGANGKILARKNLY